MKGLGQQPGSGELVSPILRFDALARSEPSKTCVVVDSFSYTRVHILEAADALAAGLTAYGIGKGDRIAIVRRNAPIHMIALLAASRIGAVLLPLNFRLSSAECQTIIDDAGCAAVLCGPRFARQFDEELNLSREILWIVDDIDPSIEPPEDDSLHFIWLRLSELYRAGEGLVPDALPIDSDTLALLLYTSGSTGKPKGVKLTYGNIFASWSAFSSVLGTGPDDVALAIAPFGHVGGLNTFTFATLLAGGLVVVQRKWDVGDALAKIEHYRVTRTFGVPTMYDAMARHPDFSSRDLSSLKTAIVGGAVCPRDLFDVFAARGVPLANSWGMTETAGGGTLTPPQDMAKHCAQVGKAAPGMTMRVTREDGSAASVGEVGELSVCGPSVSPGYWGKPEGQGCGFSGDGWFRTGDLVSVDAEGFYTIEGRVKDLIISGGENIFPAEIETVLREHPCVADAVVIGMPDNRWGELPAAFVVVEDGAELAVEDLRAFAFTRLAKYKVPRTMIEIEDIPLGSTGKPDRQALVEIAAHHHDPGPRWYAYK
jgi:Acyl-CoA synthetases (AMP-forming)/AMP-acid ligases II